MSEKNIAEGELKEKWIATPNYQKLNFMYLLTFVGLRMNILNWNFKGYVLYFIISIYIYFFCLTDIVFNIGKIEILVYPLTNWNQFSNRISNFNIFIQNVCALYLIVCMFKSTNYTTEPF